MNEVEEILYLCFLAVLFSFLFYPVFQEVKHDTVVKKIIKKNRRRIKKRRTSRTKKYYRQKTKASKNIIQYNFVFFAN